MAFAQYLLPALALAGAAFAQCSNSGTLTIASAADASQLASCTTYSGSVAIETGLAYPMDNNGRQQVEVTTVRTITGNLTVTDAISLSSLSFGSLRSIGGFELGGLTVLSELSMPALTEVSQLNFTALPALQTLDFGNPGLTRAESVLITNTGLSSLMGISNLEQVDTFNINNNQALQNISLQVTSITGALRIEANDGYQSGLTTSFPLLETATNMTFRNCSTISLPALNNVTEDLGFYGNTFETFVAPNLTSAGGLIFVDNTELTNISLPQLTAINATYQIANNTQLKQVDGFTKLSVVKGALDFSGNFTDVQLPALTQVQGAFNLQTSARFDCAAFDQLSTNKVIRGKYTCLGMRTKPGGQGTGSGSSGGGDDEQSSAGQLFANLPVAVGGTLVLAGLLQIIL
ncbi:cell wall protein Ecm33 [Xanthoria parietina]